MRWKKVLTNETPGDSPKLSDEGPAGVQKTSVGYRKKSNGLGKTEGFRSELFRVKTPSTSSGRCGPTPDTGRSSS